MQPSNLSAGVTSPRIHVHQKDCPSRSAANESPYFCFVLSFVVVIASILPPQGKTHDARATGLVLFRPPSRHRHAVVPPPPPPRGHFHTHGLGVGVGLGGVGTCRGGNYARLYFQAWRLSLRESERGRREVPQARGHVFPEVLRPLWTSRYYLPWRDRSKRTPRPAQEEVETWGSRVRRTSWRTPDTRGPGR